MHVHVCMSGGKCVCVYANMNLGVHPGRSLNDNFCIIVYKFRNDGSVIQD